MGYEIGYEIDYEIYFTVIISFFFFNPLEQNRIE